LPIAFRDQPKEEDGAVEEPSAPEAAPEEPPEEKTQVRNTFD